MRDGELSSVLLVFGAFLILIAGTAYAVDSYLLGVSRVEDATAASEAIEVPQSGDQAQERVQPNRTCRGERLLGCRTPGSDLVKAYPDAQACDGEDHRVCLVPLGDVPVALLDHLVDYYETEYGLDIRVLAPIEVDFIPHHERQQYSSDELIFAIQQTYPLTFREPEVVLIGLTALDIFNPAYENFSYIFGRRYTYSWAAPQAIVSSFRMDDRIYGLPYDQDLTFSRVRKMLNKYIAIMYYGIPESSDPRSVTYNDIGGPDDLDRMDERIPVAR